MGDLAVERIAQLEDRVATLELMLRCADQGEINGALSGVVDPLSRSKIDNVLKMRELSNGIIHPDKLYTTAEAAGHLACSKANAYNLMMCGELARIKVGAGAAGFRVRGSDLVAFLDSRREGGPKPQGSFKYLKPR